MKVELVRDVLIDTARNTDSPVFRQAVDRDVDAVTVDVVFLDDDIALIDPHTESNTLVLGNMRIALAHRPLDIDRTLHSADR